MKKVFVYLFGIMSVILYLVSCKSSKQNVIIEPETIKIKGTLGDYYNVVDKEYKVTIDEEDFMKQTVISIIVKRNDSDLPFDAKKAEPYGSNSEGKNVKVGLGIELLDEDGNSVGVVQATASGFGGVYSHEDIEALIRLQKGETATIRWKIDNEILLKTKKFVITSASEVEDDYNDVLSIESYDDSDNNIDALLDSYEEYMEKYISIMKEAQTGGNIYNMIDNQAELLSKSEELSQKLENARGTMTTSQIARFTKIQAKMMKSIYE